MTHYFVRQKDTGLIDGYYSSERYAKQALKTWAIRYPDNEHEITSTLHRLDHIPDYMYLPHHFYATRGIKDAHYR